ncbi:MAG: N-formylglutamate amidohydrolase [Pseudomonadota bacterium]
MTRTGFHTAMPEKLTSSVVFASPHSGRDYSWAFMRRSALSELAIRSSEDAFVDQLIDGAPLLGCPLLTATVPRAFVDMNRSDDELDPALIDGVKKSSHNPRVASGLGVIPRVVANGRAIYRGKLSLDEARSRLQHYWHPYHSELRRLLQNAHMHFGQAILADFHSMPHEALDSISRRGQPRPDVVIGDRFGASASSDIVQQVEAAFTKAGFNVARNTPFAGAYVTQTYGRPSRNQHAIQIELDRSLYMAERKLAKSARFGRVRSALSGVIADIADLGRPKQALPMAAE